MRMILLASFLALPLAGQAQPTSETPVVKPYPLDTCVVSDEAFDGEPKVLVVEGQEIKVCCNKCKKKVLADPATYLKKIADAKK